MTVKWTPKPDLPAPPLDTGAAGWLKKNLFSSVWSTLLTVLGTFVILSVVPPFIRWAIVNAAWVGDSKEACIHLSEGGISGACWVFIKVRLGMFMYGFYPDAERWRVNFTLLLLALGALPVLMPRALDKTRPALIFAASGVAAAVILFGPGPGLAAAAMLLLPFGLPYLPLKFDRIPVKAWQWIFLFTVYPLLAYVLLTGKGLRPRLRGDPPLGRHVPHAGHRRHRHRHLAAHRHPTGPGAAVHHAGDQDPLHLLHRTDPGGSPHLGPLHGLDHAAPLPARGRPFRQAPPGPHRRIALLRRPTWPRWCGAGSRRSPRGSTRRPSPWGAATGV